MIDPDVLKSTTEISLARKLRYSVIQSLYSGNELSKEQAVDLLRGELSPGDLTTFYDDSAWLE